MPAISNPPPRTGDPATRPDPLVIIGVVLVVVLLILIGAILLRAWS